MNVWRRINCKWKETNNNIKFKSIKITTKKKKMNLYRKFIEINREIHIESQTTSNVFWNSHCNIFRTAIEMYWDTIKILSKYHRILLLQISIESLSNRIDDHLIFKLQISINILSKCIKLLLKSYWNIIIFCYCKLVLIYYQKIIELHWIF